MISVSGTSISHLTESEPKLTCVCRVQGSATPSARPVVAAKATKTRREAPDTTVFSSDEVFVPTRSRAVHNHTGTPRYTGTHNHTGT